MVPCFFPDELGGPCIVIFLLFFMKSAHHFAYRVFDRLYSPKPTSRSGRSPALRTAVCRRDVGGFSESFTAVYIIHSCPYPDAQIRSTFPLLISTSFCVFHHLGKPPFSRQLLYSSNCGQVLAVIFRISDSIRSSGRFFTIHIVLRLP